MFKANAVSHFPALQEHSYLSDVEKKALTIHREGFFIARLINSRAKLM
ncbi:MAG: hypothetical protein AABZ78_12355 [Chloroflexota bacterium]